MNQFRVWFSSVSSVKRSTNRTYVYDTVQDGKNVTLRKHLYPSCTLEVEDACGERILQLMKTAGSEDRLHHYQHNGTVMENWCDVPYRPLWNKCEFFTKTRVEAEPSEAAELKTWGKLAFTLIIYNSLFQSLMGKTHSPAVLSRVRHISRISSFFDIAAHFTISVWRKQGPCSHHQTQTVVKRVSLLWTIFCEVAVAQYVITHNILYLGRHD